MVLTVVFLALACALARGDTIRLERSGSVALQNSAPPAAHGAITRNPYVFPLARYLLDGDLAEVLSGCGWPEYFRQWQCTPAAINERFGEEPAIPAETTVTKPFASFDREWIDSSASYTASSFSLTAKQIDSTTVEEGFASMITPVPEPSTWAGAALAAVAVTLTQRRRFRRTRR